MRLWLSMLAIAVATAVMKAVGPLALGSRELPDLAQRVVGLLAPTLLAGLIIVELAGPGWTELDTPQVVGAGVAGVTYVARVPMLLAVLAGVAAAALLRQM
ncbi:branched-chain amino acid ABC transporter [Knoellia sinensis KCTC 19936]|uniref:Branched-chain amino acid ABC transporter n=1 Tax=Knoellia sinensis KCTC 19936 TaxID=1385520 RepID=A0A0A0J6H6_9MICO|nr:AzlD domain-containing protein [Knoellia sinensis]KGN32940.1 branched-chain amino acid ABC transporter [Knoellia sinensis KCTC 19936]